jgi:hypothetical protein
MTRSARVSGPAGVPDRQVSGVHHWLGQSKRFRFRRSHRRTKTHSEGARSGSETRAQRASRGGAGQKGTRLLFGGQKGTPKGDATHIRWDLMASEVGIVHKKSRVPFFRSQRASRAEACISGRGSRGDFERDACSEWRARRGSLTPPECPTARSPASITGSGHQSVFALGACSEGRRPIGQALGRGRRPAPSAHPAWRRASETGAFEGSSNATLAPNDALGAGL